MDNNLIPKNGRLQVCLPDFVWDYLDRERIRLNCSNIPQVVRETLMSAARTESLRNKTIESLSNITPEQIEKLSKLSEFMNL